MDLHLHKKVFIVTGGAKGIGEAIAFLLDEEGASVIVVDKDAIAGNTLTGRLKNKSLFLNEDITSPNACSRCVDQTIDIFGRIDGVVNNAGINDGVGLEHGTPEGFIRSMNNNVAHYYYFAQFALPYLKQSRGSIVNISSKTALTGQGNTSGYVAAKGAILSLTREWAVELLKYRIRVNAVIPAEVWTPLYASWLNNQDNPEAKLKRITANIPLEQRMTTPREIADMVAFLLSDRASHITGQWMHVDGGYVHLDRAIDQP